MYVYVYACMHILYPRINMFQCFDSSLQDLQGLRSQHCAACMLRISLLGVIIAIAGILDALSFADQLLHMQDCQNKGSDWQRDTSKT